MKEGSAILTSMCKLIKASLDGNWDILKCPGSSGAVYYVVRTLDSRPSYIVDAFIKAKQGGLINELTTIYVMECGDEWVGAVGIYKVALNIAVTDYSKKECFSRFMEIVDAVIKGLNKTSE